jgi:hypothetical protein
MAQKCRQCGLVNWDYDEFCKRCSASLKAVTPPVYRWFVAYSIFMALLYAFTALMGIFFLFMEPDAEMSAEEAKIMGSVMIAMGLLFCVPYAAAPFLPRQSWVWILGLVLICIGLTSACCLPACVPLLIFWLKPEMKAFYGRNLDPVAPPPPPQWG